MVGASTLQGDPGLGAIHRSRCSQSAYGTARLRPTRRQPLWLPGSSPEHTYPPGHTHWETETQKPSGAGHASASHTAYAQSLRGQNMEQRERDSGCDPTNHMALPRGSIPGTPHGLRFGGTMQRSHSWGRPPDLEAGRRWNAIPGSGRHPYSPPAIPPRAQQGMAAVAQSAPKRGSLQKVPAGSRRVSKNWGQWACLGPTSPLPTPASSCSLPLSTKHPGWPPSGQARSNGFGGAELAPPSTGRDSKEGRALSGQARAISACPQGPTTLIHTHYSHPPHPGTPAYKTFNLSPTSAHLPEAQCPFPTPTHPQPTASLLRCHPPCPLSLQMPLNSPEHPGSLLASVFPQALPPHLPGYSGPSAPASPHLGWTTMPRSRSKGSDGEG